MQKILESYLRRLTNLSGNNRSLLLLRLISDQFIDLHDFDYEDGSNSFDIIEKLIMDNKEIRLSDEVDPRSAGTNNLSGRLKKLIRVEEFIFQERGSKDLYVGWPFISGKFMDDTLVRCPLIFFAVEVLRKNGSWFLRRRKDVNVTLNKSFLLAYAHFNQVQLDEELLELVLNDFDKDATVFRTELYQTLKESNVELNFNKENFKDELTPFKNQRRAELEKSEKKGTLKLNPEAVLGIFPQAGSYLVPDYIHLIENRQYTDLEEFFLKRIKSDPEDEGRTRFSDRVLEENTYTPFQLDAHQEEAIKKIKKGNSMTIQGPPGTGKSQLISNLICDYVARGKNVLLVCQKKAALDVVYERLKQKELHDFLGLVHDFKNDRKDVFEKIANQIDRIDGYRQKNNALDTIQLERTFTHASRKIEAISEELEEYKFALFDESECGKSAKELYVISNPNDPHVHLNQFYHQFEYKDTHVFLEKLERYFTYYEEYESKPHFWAHELSFAEFNSTDYIRIKEALDDTVSTFSSFVKDSSDLLHKELDYDTSHFFVEKRLVLDQLKTNLDNETIYKSFKHLLKYNPDEEGDWLADMEKKILQSFSGKGIETSLSAEELGRFQESLENAIKARKNPFRWIQWRLFSKDRIFITRVLVSNKLKGNKKGFTTLIERIDNRLNYEHNVSLILSKDWLTDYPEKIKKTEIQNWFFFQKNAFKTFFLYKDLRNLDVFISFKSDDRKSQVDLLQKFLHLIDQFPKHIEEWNKYLTEHQIRELLSGRVSQEEAKKQLDKDFENLHDYHHIKANFSNAEKSIVDLLEEVEGPKAKKIDCFNNSLALVWIDHIESKYPVLRTISSLKFEQNLKELRQAIDDKRQTSKDILILKSRERTYQDLEFNRLNNLVTYRELQHQVTKKKKVWPLRRVISEYREELFKLIPCWMASPESASAIFPMDEIFDLVIFDEASQCFAERGIPSMYRGRQIVVVGDSKQLKPFDLYRVRWEDEDSEDNTPELEINSLLELAERYLPSTALMGHYRSQSLELVDFSNQHFYDGTLQLVPDFHKVNDEIMDISYIKVNGVWSKNTNLSEAEKVIGLIKELQKESPEKTIGIVTFNAPQQSLILDLIDQQVENGFERPDHLFVKNIENVQGDERDIIIFSTAYAKDENGVFQMKFGSLNMEGGENRLNVAITRAREKIYLITSLSPSDISADHAKNKGPQLFASYLKYAHQVSNKKWTPFVLPPRKEEIHWYLKTKLKNLVPDGEKEEKLDEGTPYADLVIRSNGKINGLILTDDDQYYGARSAKDIYIYRQELFENKNWPSTRINSREVWMDTDKVLSELRVFVNASLNAE